MARRRRSRAGRIARRVGGAAIGAGLVGLAAYNLPSAAGYLAAPARGYASRFAGKAAYRVGIRAARGALGAYLIRSNVRLAKTGVGMIRGRGSKGGAKKGHPFYGNQYVHVGGRSRGRRR